MALRLVQYADASPDIGWPRDGTHYVAMSGSVQVGSIIQNKGDPYDGSWTWTITCLVPHAPAWNGVEASKEDAQAALTSAWRRWLARAGVVEDEPASYQDRECSVCWAMSLWGWPSLPWASSARS